MKLETENARVFFNESGLSYSAISSREVARLQEAITEELTKGNALSMNLCKLRKKDVEYNSDGSIKHLFLRVDGFYFKGREAISFNNGGFIGFAGWASSDNVAPFINAFIKWCSLVNT